MDSPLSLLIWSVLDFVDFKLVQEDLSSNRGAGRGWCLWPMLGSGTIHPRHPGSTNQPTNHKNSVKWKMERCDDFGSCLRIGVGLRYL